jgi:cytochrome c oxidase subunit IV
VTKASLVILFFMHVWYSQPLTWVVALSGLLWLAILLTYTLTDYMSRGWNGVPGH